ncbi:hypothetical protein MASR2M50_37450 [Thauera sp.]
MSTRIGIDLGGTKIELVVLDAAGCERWRRRVATPQGDYAGTLHAIAALVDEAERVTGAGARVGIGTPGSPSPRDGRIRNANSTCLNGQALQQDLEALLRRPIRLANDANCLAMSEAADGAGAGARTVFAAILGTGVGGGIVVDGKLLVGANAVAGEWGHNPLPLPDADDLPLPPCYCGRAGCIETYLSGPGLAADHLRHGGEPVDAAGIARRADCRRARQPGQPRTLRGAARARARNGHQPARPRGDRARRRPVAGRAPVRQRATAVGKPRVLGQRLHPPAAGAAR